MKNIIYCHYNKITKKYYVGSTIQSLERRFRKSDNTYNSYKNCPAFYRALKKYGWNAFETILLFITFKEGDLPHFEEYFIKKYNSLAPNGYNSINITDGRVKYTDEVRKKISNSRKKYYKNLDTITEAVNKKHHKKINGKKHKHCYKCDTWKPLNEFYKNKRRWDGYNYWCSNCSRDYTNGNRPKNNLTEGELKQSYQKRTTKARPFIGTNKNGKIIRFESGMDASRNNYDKTQIRRAILKQKEYKGYMWSYGDDLAKNKIFARKCEIKHINTDVAKKFLNKYHRQRSSAAKVRYGLYYNDELVSVMTLGHSRFDKKYKWEIMRLCTKNDIIVIGGASKMFKAFVKEYDPESVLTYAHLDYSKAGAVYEKLGFKHIGKSQPSYEYKKGKRVLSRYQCQKHKLPKILKNKFDPNKTEKQNMLDAGFVLVDLPGNNKYLWTKS